MKIPVEREELKIRERGSELLGTVLWSVIEEIHQDQKQC